MQPGCASQPSCCCTRGTPTSCPGSHPPSPAQPQAQHSMHSAPQKISTTGIIHHIFHSTSRTFDASSIAALKAQAGHSMHHPLSPSQHKQDMQDIAHHVPHGTHRTIEHCLPNREQDKQIDEGIAYHVLHNTVGMIGRLSTISFPTQAGQLANIQTMHWCRKENNPACHESNPALCISVTTCASAVQLS